MYIGILTLPVSVGNTEANNPSLGCIKWLIDEERANSIDIAHSDLACPDTLYAAKVYMYM